MKKIVSFIVVFTQLICVFFAQNNGLSVYSDAVQIVVTPKAIDETTESSILFNKKDIDFGKLLHGDKSTLIVEFTNNSLEPIKIESITEFAFLKAEFPSKSIAPNETGKIKITLLSERIATEFLNQLLEKEITVLFKYKDKNTGTYLVSKLNLKAFISL